MTAIHTQHHEDERHRQHAMNRIADVDAIQCAIRDVRTIIMQVTLTKTRCAFVEISQAQARKLLREHGEHVAWEDAGSLLYVFAK